MYMSVRVGLHVWGGGANEVWSEMNGYYIICVYIDDCMPLRELGSNSNKRCHTVLCNHEIVLLQLLIVLTNNHHHHRQHYHVV